MLYLFVRVRTSLKNDYSGLQESTAIVTRTLTDGLSHIISSKAFLLEKMLQRRYFHDMSTMWRGRFKVWRRRYSYEAVLSAITGVVPIAVLWYGTREVASHHLTVGQLVAFMSFFGYLYRPAEGMVISLLAMQNSMVAADRIFEILDLPEERQLRAASASATAAILCGHPGSIAPLLPDIAITDVGVGYPGSPHRVLSNVNLEIFPGEVVQIVGPSGAGKSTLAKLLTGLLQPCTGSFYIQGKEQFSIPLEQLRRLVLLVTHEPGILSASVLANIMCGAKNATVDEALDAARLVHAHEFISRLPQGYDTKISKDGAVFSSGQIQRIILARALLRRPAILILDEAMSFLDRATATEIMANIRIATAGKTLINICHRGYGIRPSDRQIIVQDGGLFQPDNRHDFICEPLSRPAFGPARVY
jgi:ABC-type bacteriocin/lantibiotic exporter with double-glycine peptidase domain